MVISWWIVAFLRCDGMTSLISDLSDKPTDAFCNVCQIHVGDVLPEDILTSLDQVSGRKHPSTTQVKQLKASLPMMPVLQHMISSQVLILSLFKIKNTCAKAKLFIFMLSPSHLRPTPGLMRQSELYHNLYITFILIWCMPSE